MRVSLTEYNGVDLLDVRAFYPSGGEMKPGKGLSIRRGSGDAAAQGAASRGEGDQGRRGGMKPCRSVLPFGSHGKALPRPMQHTHSLLVPFRLSAYKIFTDTHFFVPTEVIKVIGLRLQCLGKRGTVTAFFVGSEEKGYMNPTPGRQSSDPIP